MKTKGLETFLYSTAGVVAMLIILFACNIIASRVKGRVDLTSERAYTLSQGTRNILAKLDTPVKIRFYCTQNDVRMPVALKTYAQHVEDLLGEYRQASKGQIEIQKLDPEPDSDAEDSAKLDGVEGQRRLDGEPIYLGLSVSMLDQKEAIPFLAPNHERLLEYEISRAISRVITPEKPVVGVMSAMPIQGQPMNQMMMQMGRQGQPPWVFYSELQHDFDVKKIEMTVDKIPDDVKVLVVIHPKGITDAAQYAIDQFVLRGGKLIAFLDPSAALDRQQQQQMMAPSSSSSLDKLLKAWGLGFDTTKVVADMDFVGRTRQGRAPAVLALNEKAVNKDDVLTSDLDNLFLIFVGAFTGTPMEGLKETVLLHSSKNSQLVDPMTAQMAEEQVAKDFSPSGIQYALAVRLTGKFKTAFPAGKPKAEEKPGDKKPEEKPEEGLKESTKENTVILVGDSDMIQDAIAVTEAMNPFGGQRMVMRANGNLGFAQSTVEQLSGDSNLISVRSRASRDRPFTVVRTMQAEAEAKYRSKMKEIETIITETNSRLAELQRAKTGDAEQRLIRSPEQEEEIANAKKKVAENKAQLKLVKRQLNADVDSLENRIKWANIAGMPLIVIGAGLALAWNRRKKQAAR